MQPSVYAYENIIEAVVAIIRDQGWSAVTTRAIAKKIGSSTMPIYSRVKSVADLEPDVRRNIRECLKDYQRRKYTEDALLNAAVGYVVFARDEKNLFRYLYFERPDTLDIASSAGMSSEFEADFGLDSSEHRALAQFQQADRDALVQYTWIFVHGLAALVNAGVYGSVSDETIMELLTNAGGAFFTMIAGAGGSDLSRAPSAGGEGK